MSIKSAIGLRKWWIKRIPDARCLIINQYNWPMLYMHHPLYAGFVHFGEMNILAINPLIVVQVNRDNMFIQFKSDQRLLEFNEKNPAMGQIILLELARGL